MRRTILNERLERDADHHRRFQQERTILEVTEMICALMKRKGMNRSELAERIGKSKGHVSQLLDGRRNMTLRTLSDLLFALDSSLVASSESLHRDAQHAGAAKDAPSS